jgi:16S rRNA (cytosine1402-N4)-methyltransferase
MHIPVLLEETIQGLGLERFSKGVVIDGTVNNAGHAIEILERFPKLHLMGFDLDHGAVERATHALLRFKDRAKVYHASYERMKEFVVPGSSVVGVLFDFGLSSDQLQGSERGFTFAEDEPLDMRFDTTSGNYPVTAADAINDWGEDTLVSIFTGFGEEKYAKRIARAIVASREEGRINSTATLVDIIKGAVPATYRHGRIHPATRTFQALRIAVNRELDAVTQGLKVAWDVLSPEGRIAAISFHSLEDRIVKRYFRELADAKEGKLLTKRPIEGGEKEVEENPRSRSAKLRIVEKTH